MHTEKYNDIFHGDGSSGLMTADRARFPSVRPKDSQTASPELRIAEAPPKAPLAELGTYGRGALPRQRVPTVSQSRKSRTVNPGKDLDSPRTDYPVELSQKALGTSMSLLGERGKITRDSAVGESAKSQPSAWTLAFFGLMFYALVEYSRLPEMYPLLEIFALGKVSVVLAMVGYMVSPGVRRNGRPASRGIDVGVSVFVVGAILSACLNYQEPHVWGNLIGVLYYAIVYFLITRALSDLSQIRILLLLILLLNLKLARHTVWSYSLHRSAGMSAERIYMSGGAGQGSSSFFGNVADLGLAMVVVWGIVWPWLIGKVEKSKITRLFLVACFVFFFLAIIFCGSRGAMLGAAMIVFVALARSPKRAGAAFLAIIFVLGVWLIMPNGYKDRFQSAWNWQNDPDSASRITYWGLGLEMFEQNPIVGVGPGDFINHNPFGQVAHSMYVQALSESGLVGTIAFVAMLVCFFRQNARTRRLLLQVGGPGRRSFPYCLAFGLDLAMAGFMASAAFLSVLYYPHLWILLGLSVALNKCCVNAAREQEPIETVALRQRKFAPVPS